MASVNVLLVEDNEADRYLIRHKLATSDLYRVTEAPTLARGIENLDNDDIDVVLLDLGLPDARGTEGIIRLQNHPIQPPVIVLTGDEEYGTTISTLREGAHDYITKSDLSNDAVLDAISSTLRRAALFDSIANAARERRGKDTPSAGRLPPVRMRDPRRFARLVIAYMNALDRRIDAILYNNDEDDTAAIDAIAGQLVDLNADGGDIVEIHLGALQQAPSQSAPQRARALARSSRSLLVDVMQTVLCEYR